VSGVYPDFESGSEPTQLELPAIMIPIDHAFVQTYTPAVNAAILQRHQLSASMVEYCW
jgi:hypothetical protein